MFWTIFWSLGWFPDGVRDPNFTFLTINLNAIVSELLLGYLLRKNFKVKLKIYTTQNVLQIHKFEHRTSLLYWRKWLINCLSAT